MLVFDPPPERVSARLELKKDVLVQLKEAVDAHCAAYGEKALSLDDALSHLINEAVRKDRPNGRARRKKPA